MRIRIICIVFASCVTTFFALCTVRADDSAKALDENKQAAVESIERRGDESWAMASKIWGWAEPGYQETKSSALLAEAMEKAGFKVERGAADIPTAIVATFGEGKPVIGILGEYDALPGLAQSNSPQRDPVEGSGFGHGCGHHLFGVASASAAIAVAEQIKAGKLSGTVRFYGCPAEEGGSAKAFLVQAGLFNDCDAVLHWHPSSQNAAGDVSCLARMAVKFRFHGKSSHASGSPDAGRSALDAVALTNHAAELLREHVPKDARIHYVVTYGGGAPNVVPDFAEVFYYIRHPKSATLRKLYPRLVKCAEAGALATETRLEMNYIGGTLELLPNNTLAQAALANLRKLNDLKYDDQERQYAERLFSTQGKLRSLDSVRRVVDRSGTTGGGSTDVGDVSWVVPVTGFNTACWPPGTPGHSWQAVASGGTSFGRKGMQLAAKTLAATACDLYLRPDLLAASKAEHAERRKKNPYEPLLEKDQKPPLDYRNPPRP